MTDKSGVSGSSANCTYEYSFDSSEDISDPALLVPLDLACSRPVWDEAEAELCVWHADKDEKSPEELAAEIEDGSRAGPGEEVGPLEIGANNFGAGLVEAQAPKADFRSIKFPDSPHFVNSDLSGANLSSADLSHGRHPDSDFSEADLSDANLFNAAFINSDLTDAVLHDTNLSEANLSSADLSGAELSNADLTGAHLWRTDFSDTNLIDANISGTDLSGAYLPEDLSGAELSDVILPEDLSGVNLSGATLPEDLSGVNLSGAKLSNADLSGADLSNAELCGADVLSADLSGADLSGARLFNADLSGADLSNAELCGADLLSADLSGAHLSGSLLRNAILRGTNLSGATLTGADLTDAIFSIYEFDFPGADLSDSDLSDADLTGAVLRGANISDADLTRANLSGVDLTDAELSDANLTDAILRSEDLTANFERANLTRADLFDANLSGAAFYGAVTTDTQLNENTEFGAHYTNEEQSVGDADPQRARWCLRQIESLADANALPDLGGEAFFERRQVRRHEARIKKDWEEWVLSTIIQWVMGYGESLARVLRTSVVVILVSTILYPVWGVKTTAGQRLFYPSIDSALTAPIEFSNALLSTLLTSLYFSVLTFTTLGFGDLQPVGLGRALATFEAGAGITLFALLVFVLGRRSTQ